MKDRLPAYGMANRVKITQDDGNIVEGVLSYADGATQEGSVYNKANILPDSICKALGLSVESEPKDMFGVLADCGNLHVWRKEVVVADKIPAIPAGYTIGELVNLNLTVGIPIHYGKSGEWEYVTDVSSIFVSDDGAVHFNNAKSFSISDGPIGYDISEVNVLKGKYVRCAKLPEGWGSEGIEPSAPPSVGNVYYFPADTAFIKKEFSTSVEHNGEMVNFFEIMATKYKEVIGYPYTPEIPAGTTVTYPVSTNRNAYQEGNDAKPAGYTLGEVKTGSFAITSKSSPGGVGTLWNDSAALSVSDDGACTLATTGGTYIDGTTTNAATTAKNELQGKFAYCNNTDTDFASSVIVFFPSNTIFTRVGNIVYADRYQPVTGYAAIPANTTIEYLGCLGDKARVQVVSYVGTGTYGGNNKNSLTFDFPPKILLIAMAQLYSNQTYTGILYPFVGYGSSFLGSDRGYVYSLLCNKNENSVSWWNENDYGTQLNISGCKYTAIAIG